MLPFLLNPIAPQVFFDRYYEKRYLKIHRQDPDYFAKLLSYDQVDEMLFSMHLHHPQTRIVDNAQETFPDAEGYTVGGSKRIDPLKFLRHYAEGSTMVFSGAQERLFSLRRLTNEMENFFKHSFQTNLYLTPQNAQGFSPHYDTHDVFILQFAGRKRWRIYDYEKPLPDKSMPFLKKEMEPGALIDEFTLEAGDTLYIPRGVMHDAYCTDANSGHITLGLLGKNYAEKLAGLLLDRSQDHLALRRYPKFHAPESAQDELREVQETLHRMVDQLLEDPELRKDFHGRQNPLARGMLHQFTESQKLDPATPLCLREPEQIRLQLEGDTLAIYFYDLKAELPASCKPYLDWLLAQEEPAPVQDWPAHMDLDSRMVLAEELFKLGALARVHAPATEAASLG